MSHKLIGNLSCKRRLKSAGHVDRGKLRVLAIRIGP